MSFHYSSIYLHRAFNFSGENKNYFTKDIAVHRFHLQWRSTGDKNLFFFEKTNCKVTRLGSSTSFSWTGSDTQLFFIFWKILQANPWSRNGNQDGTQLHHPFRRLCQRQTFRFFLVYNGLKHDLYKCFVNNCVGSTLSNREELTTKLKATVYRSAYITNPHVPTVTYYIHPPPTTRKKLHPIFSIS